MRDSRLDRLADVLVGYSTRVKRGDLVAITADPTAFPGVEAVYRRVIEAGGHPFWNARAEALDEIDLLHGTNEQLAYLSPLSMHMVETIDVQISLWAENNTRSMGRIEPARVATHRQARRPFMHRFLDRAAKGELRWVGTQYPTLASAQDAEMSLEQYEDFVFRGGLLHLPDPVAEWRAIKDRQQSVCDYLQGKQVVRFRATACDGHDGTDLSVDVSRGTWINCAGLENFPDGEVFAGPQGADGHVNFTYPAVYDGREVEGVRLVFKCGRVVDATARKNEAFLIAMLDQDEGARTMGEIAIGTNYAITEFTRNTLFDEKIGGTFHMACGAGYPESGSTNESALHWDMVCDLRRGGSIEADGEVFYRDGAFLNKAWPGTSV